MVLFSDTGLNWDCPGQVGYRVTITMAHFYLLSLFFKLHLHYYDILYDIVLSNISYVLYNNTDEIITLYNNYTNINIHVFNYL